MIAQAAACATRVLTVLIAAGVLFQMAMVARMAVRIVWHQASQMWNKSRSPKKEQKPAAIANQLQDFHIYIYTMG